MSADAPQVSSPSAPDAAPQHDAGKKLVADAGRIGGATFLIYVLNFLSGVLLPVILVPKEFGIWRMVQLAMTYMHLLNLGLSRALDKSGPTLVATGRLRRFEKLMGVCVSFGMIVPVALALILLISIPWTLPFGLGLFLAVIAITAPLQHLVIFAEVALLIKKRYGAAANVTLVVTAARLVALAVLGFAFGLTGVLVGFLLTLGLHTFLMMRKAQTRFPISFNRRVGFKLWKAGAMLTAVHLGDILIGTADKLVVPFFLGAEQNGFYGVAILPLPILTMISLAFRQVAAMEIFDCYKREGSVRGAQRIYVRSFLVTALTYPLIGGAACYGLPMLIHLFRPQYAIAVNPAIAHTILVFPLLLTPTAVLMMAVLNMEWRAFFWQAGMAVAAATCSSLAVSLGGVGLLGVVLIHGAAWFIYGAGLLLFVQRQFGDPWHAALINTAKFLFPIPFMALTLAVEFEVLLLLGLEPHSVAFAILGGLLHTLACAPLFWVLEKKTGMMSDALAKLRRTIQR